MWEVISRAADITIIILGITILVAMWTQDL